MTTLIESILIDRLIQQVERRTRAEDKSGEHVAALGDAALRIVDLEKDFARANEKADAMEKLADRKASQVNDMIRSRNDAEKRLFALYEAADALVKEIARRKNPHKVDDLRRRLGVALQTAHDDCGQIPF
jgi:hypothetical protein